MPAGKAGVLPDLCRGGALHGFGCGVTCRYKKKCCANVEDGKIMMQFLILVDLYINVFI
jgi:hypothetical protein